MGAINMLHLRYKAETGNEAEGGHHENVTVSPGVVRNVWIPSGGAKREYVQWLEDLVDRLEEKIKLFKKIETLELNPYTMTEEEIEKFKKDWYNNLRVTAAYIQNVAIRGKGGPLKIEQKEKSLGKRGIDSEQVKNQDKFMSGYVNQD